MIAVSATGLTKDYKNTRAVDGIDFTIEQGECFGFLGPNGAGKTTTMRMIHCFFPPGSGELKVFGLDVREHPSAIKARLGIMPQDDNLDPDLSVIQNLLVYARYFDMPSDIARKRAGELLAFTELTGRELDMIKSLSGGLKRRLLLARALINKPEMLLLDEPTTGLDPYSRRAVWDRLDTLKFENTTLILTTHYMEEAERLCDRVAIMDSGRIVAVDTPAGLMELHGGNLEDVYLKIAGRPLEA